jgi:hypothetical protein
MHKIKKDIKKLKQAIIYNRNQNLHINQILVSQQNLI